MPISLQVPLFVEMLRRPKPSKTSEQSKWQIFFYSNDLCPVGRKGN